MSKDISQITVDELFLIADEHRILAHLSAFEWDFKRIGPVVLKRGGTQICARVIGSGNHEGKAVLMLQPMGGWDQVIEAMRQIEENERGAIFLLWGQGAEVSSTRGDGPFSNLQGL